ncbi:MAG: TonB-dependent receptor [Rhodoferax sp.]|nr:TonB-dependent receptor [Rhodoferax sp.]
MAIFAAFPVLAQNSLPDVFVTASRSEQAIELAPIGASVILREDILASGATDANQAIRMLGGVTGRRDLNGGRESVLDLRGFGDSAANNLVVLVDGVRISENEISGARLSAISPEMIERIEIVRGSSSVLWGEGASAGVINVITRSGAQAKGVHGAVALAVESFNGRDARGDIQVDSDSLSFSGQVRAYRTDGYRDNSQHTDDSLNAKFAFGDRQSLKTNFALFSESLDMRWPGALPLATYLTAPRQTNTPLDLGRQRQDRWTLTLEKQVGDALVSADLARRERHANSFQDYGFGFTESNRSESVSYQFSPRVSWTNDWGSAMASTVLGLDWTQWDYTRMSDFSGFVTDEKGTQRSQAIYLRTDLALASQWRLNAGFRTEKFHQTSDNLTFSSGLKSDPSLTAAELGLSHALNERWTAYARLASSYRVANVDELRFLSTSLEPQTAKDFELGLRYRQGVTSYGARLFEQRTHNEIAYDNNVGFGANVNLDPVQRQGIEMEGSTQLTRQLKFSAVAQVLRARLSEGTYAGHDLPLASKANVLLKAAYAFNADHAADLALRFAGSAPFGNDWTNTCSNKIEPGSFLDLGYLFKAQGSAGWAVRADVNNLLDRQSYSAGYTNGTCSAYNVYPDAGRSLKLSASYRF